MLKNIPPLETKGALVKEWKEQITEREALDFAIVLEPPEKLRLTPIIIVVSIFSGLMIALFCIGLTVALAYSAPALNEAIEFNELVMNATNCFECIVSDEEWPNCGNFCTNDPSIQLTRNITLLHASNVSECRNQLEMKPNSNQIQQKISCFSPKNIDKIPWTEWSDCTTAKRRFRIKRLPPFSAYNFHGTSPESLIEIDKQNCSSS